MQQSASMLIIASLNTCSKYILDIAINKQIYLFLIFFSVDQKYSKQQKIDFTQLSYYKKEFEFSIKRENKNENLKIKKKSNYITEKKKEKEII